MNKRKCLFCKEYFPMEDMIKPRNGWFCDFDHMTKHGLTKARKDKVKKEKKAHTKAKRKLKDEDKSFQLKKTQSIFNKYIRLRDGNSNCISCGRNHDGQYHAGHYRSVGSCPELRFDSRNCWKQCAPCNNHLSGNIVNYRASLVGRFGVGIIDYLEGPHPPKKYTIDNLKTIQKWYKRKTDRLLRNG